MLKDVLKNLRFGFPLNDMMGRGFLGTWVPEWVEDGSQVVREAQPICTHDNKVR